MPLTQGQMEAPGAGWLTVFDLPALVAYVDANGPLRHNRVDPFYETIGNGTTMDEGATEWNRNNRRRMWLFRGANAPLFWVLMSIHTDPASTRFGDHVVGMVVDPNAPFTNARDVGGEGAHGHVVLEFLPVAVGSGIELRLKFDGVELKSYTDHNHLERVEPPPEVYLS